MTISLTTYEYRVREWILDLVHGQWLTLGVPFSVRRAHPDEIIDPEALLWCSLEFFPTQPRLQEQVLIWRARHADSLLLSRLRRFAQSTADPRAILWQSLDPHWKATPKPPTEPCYAQASLGELQAFCRDLSNYVATWLSQPVQAGKVKPTLRELLNECLGTSQRLQIAKAESTCAATLLRARDVLGTDVRHFLLVYLLANQSGARLRSVAQWSGQTYQNIAKAAKRWEAANVVTLDRGFARLKNPAVWADILGIGPVTSQPLVLVNWPRFFDACITLLRYLAKANAKSLPADGPVVAGLIRQALEDAAASVESATPSHTVRDFANVLLTLSEKAQGTL